VVNDKGLLEELIGKNWNLIGEKLRLIDEKFQRIQQEIEFTLEKLDADIERKQACKYDSLEKGTYSVAAGTIAFMRGCSKKGSVKSWFDLACQIVGVIGVFSSAVPFHKAAQLQSSQNELEEAKAVMKKLEKYHQGKYEILQEIRKKQRQT